MRPPLVDDFFEDELCGWLVGMDVTVWVMTLPLCVTTSVETTGVADVVVVSRVEVDEVLADDVVAATVVSVVSDADWRTVSESSWRA